MIPTQKGRLEIALDLLIELQNIQGTNDKKAWLETNLHNAEVKYLLTILLDIKIVLGLKTVQPSGDNSPIFLATMRDFMSLVDILTVSSTTNRVRDLVTEFCRLVPKKYEDVLIGIFTKTLKIGVTAKTVNKIIPNLLFEFKCMLADTGMPDEYPVYVDTKWDGVRIIAEVTNNICKLWTRKGNLVHIPEIEKELVILSKGQSVMYDGELLSVDRKSVSGKVNSIIKKGHTPSKSRLMYFKIFDRVPLHNFNTGQSCTIPYKQRLAELELEFTQYGNTTSLIQLSIPYLVHSEDALIKLLNELLAQGEEGVIIKPIQGFYEFKRSAFWLKLKAINTATLKVVGVTQGKNSRKGLAGALMCESEDGHIEVDVGSGLTDADLKWLKSNNIIGQYVEVLYNVIISDVNDNLSLFLPRLKRNDWLRIDKEEADTTAKMIKEHIGNIEAPNYLIKPYIT